VLSSVSGLSDLAARAVCWNAVIDMVRQAELPVTAFAAMLAAAMRSEPSRPALDALRKEAAWRLLTSDGTGPETVTAVTAEFLTRIDEFITAGAADPGLARIVRDHRDTAERVLRARALKPH
jgi:hypothetical protein